MFIGSVDQERNAYIYLLLYPHGSDTNISRPKYVQCTTIYTGSQRSHALHQSAPSSSPGRGVPLRCTRSLLLGPLLVTAHNGAVNHPSLYSHITQLMLRTPSHIPHTSSNHLLAYCVSGTVMVIYLPVPNRYHICQLRKLSKDGITNYTLNASW